MLNTNRKSTRKETLKSALSSKLLPSVLSFTRVTLFNMRKNVEATHTQNWKICRKSKGLLTVQFTWYCYVVQTWYCATKTCVGYSCTGSEKSGIGKVRSESNVSRDKPVIKSPPRTECVEWNNQRQILQQLNILRNVQNKVFLETWCDGKVS